MTNLDTEKKEYKQKAEQIVNAFAGDDKDEAVEQLTGAMMEIQQKLLSEAASMTDAQDEKALMQRGMQPLTSKEKDFWQKTIGALKSANPKQALTDLDVTFPISIIDRVFEDIRVDHPLLDEITFVNAGLITRIITSSISGVAGWGELCDPITDEIGAKFEAIELNLQKLTAYIPVCIAMLDLGPAWVDRYVRMALNEVILVALEAAIVDGDGKTKPIGMTRALSGAVDGVYPRKATTAVNSLDPATIGGLLETLTVTKNGNRRPVDRLLMVVNPGDYFTKVFPAVTPRTTDGNYAQNVLPFPTTVVQSPAVPEGTAVFGLAKRYYAALASAKDGKIEYSDEYKFLDDYRYYKVRLYGNGQPLDENAFIYADISGLQPTYLKVEVVDSTTATTTTTDDTTTDDTTVAG